MLRRLVKRAPEDVLYVVVYTREPHARQMAFRDIPQPTSLKERRDLALKTKKAMRLDALFLLDEMGDPFRKLFGDVPSPAIFVDKGGRIADKLSWADASEVARVLNKWNTGKLQSRPTTRTSRPSSSPRGPASRPVSRKSTSRPAASDKSQR